MLGLFKLGSEFQKNNLLNDFPQAFTWAATPDNTFPNCPYATLHQWWKWCGKPSKGFIFSGPDKEQMNDDKTLYQVRAKAKKLGYSNKNLPTKHSCRISMVLTLKSMGVDTDTINRFMNWRSDTMQSYYLNVRNMRTVDAPAHKLSVLSQTEFTRLQNSLF